MVADDEGTLERLKALRRGLVDPKMPSWAHKELGIAGCQRRHLA